MQPQKKCGTFLKSHMRGQMMSRGQGSMLSFKSMKFLGCRRENQYLKCRKYSHIVNHLMGLGKTFEKEELNIKILKCLDRTWQSKVTAISESKYLTSMSTTSLFGKLREHKLEMNRLFVQENEDKHNKGIALKTVGHRRCQDSSDIEEDTFRFLSKKFSKFLIKNNNKHQSSKRYNSKKLSDFNTNKYTCFGCGEQGHIKAEYPNSEAKDVRINGLNKRGVNCLTKDFCKYELRMKIYESITESGELRNQSC